MDREKSITKLENDLALLATADLLFQIEICALGCENADDEVWGRGAEISRAIVSTRRAVSQMKREAGNFPIHADIPSRVGGETD